MTRQRKPNGRYLNTCRPGKGTNRVSEVPVDVVTILNGGQVPGDEDENQAA